MADKNITIADIADALGISKTTVSRAISGKGRIGEATRKRVMDYIQEHDYKPNVVAKGLAQSKTFNICIVMSDNFEIVDLPYSREAMSGIQEVAVMMEYDILLCMGRENSISSLKRIIENHKVDGVILLKTFEHDPAVEYLIENDIPFVAAGSSNYKNVVQVDYDHVNACRELTSILLGRNLEHLALLGGNDGTIVNSRRYAGYKKAFLEHGREIEPELIFLNLNNRAMIEHAVDEVLDKHADCILCLDDAICAQVLRKLRKDNIEIPERVKIASFYDSSILADNIPTITSLCFDAKELGVAACQKLLEIMEGHRKEEELRTLLPYDIVLKESTK